MKKHNFLRAIMLSVTLAAASMVASVAVPDMVIESQAADGISKKKLTLEVGESATLTVTGATVTKWTSKDTKVAVVSKNGTVTAVGSGSTKIIAKTSGKKKYKCKVTVKKSEGQETSLFDGGKGTAKDPYKVSTLEQFKAIGSFNGMYFKQTKDIDANSQTINAAFGDNNAFTGVYDGNGHTISNVMIADGLFYIVAEKGEIKNLNVRNAIVGGKNNSAGSIVAINYGRVENCSVNDISGTGVNNLGGICGYNCTGATVIKCNSSIVSFTGQSKDTSGGWGGIVGVNAGSVADCTNSSTIITNSTTSWGFQYLGIGGIVGDNNQGTVSNCSVKGVSMEVTKGYCGDIVGENTGVVVKCTSDSGNPLVGKGSEPTY